MYGDIDSLFSILKRNPLVVEPNILVFHCCFYLEGLNPKIEIKIYYSPDFPSRYQSDTSHSIHTPNQASEYDTSEFGDTIEIALDKTIDSLTGFYNDAIKQGLTPQDNWLVPNEDF